jgi:hypothetical protein
MWSGGLKKAKRYRQYAKPHTSEGPLERSSLVSAPPLKSSCAPQASLRTPEGSSMLPEVPDSTAAWQVQDLGFVADDAATRKVAPGLRLLDKYAVVVGGGDTHRMDLSSMVMLKDNHNTCTGSAILAPPPPTCSCRRYFRRGAPRQVDQLLNESTARTQPER